ncbi:MAG: inosine/xanthosine triphosphatase [Candidatus Delongbacteria bacterium]|nr:inosine/xanthosine triphosphatase [Candidatus Delongbacteria bacterium]
MKIIVSSKNPVKINATLNGFMEVFPKEVFEIEGVSVPSDVSDQPMNEEETYQGALNRAGNAYKDFPEADYWVGIEGGIEKKNSEMMTFAWVYIKSKKLEGKGRSASFFLPPEIVSLINQGKELGDADDIVFGKSNSKQKNGAVGILTGDLITRESLYIPAVIMALIPFKNETLYYKL